jgi:hypothetical protein
MSRDKFYWSGEPQDPNKWEPRGKSFWCPKFIQPVVFWVLEKFGVEVYRYKYGKKVQPKEAP